MTASLSHQDRQNLEQELADCRKDLAHMDEHPPLPNEWALEKRRLFRDATRREIVRLEAILND